MMKKSKSILVLFVIMLFTIVLSAQDYCLDFDGVDDYVNIPDAATLDPTTSYTIEAWIYAETFPGIGGIVSKYQTADAYGYTLRLTSNGDLSFDELSTSDGVLTTNTWYHIAAVNNSGTRKLYVNGEEQNLTGNTFTTLENHDPVRIGSDFQSRYFDGKIDEVRIWDDAREQIEIQNNMYNELTGDEFNLKAYYNFNEGSGSNLNDLTSNNNDGTLHNFALTGQSSNWVISDSPLPVNLSSFYALYAGGIPTLYWTTQSEEDNAYWNVYRGTTENFVTADQINTEPVPGNGTINSASDYIYIDTMPVVQNTTYWYWIEDVSTDGETELHNPITLTIPFDDAPVTPDSYGLQQNYPNPFNPSTSISFALEQDDEVELVIYNLKGEKVKTIFNDHVYADQINSVVWNGDDANGKQVSSGVYFYKLKTTSQEYSRKMILIK